MVLLSLYAFYLAYVICRSFGVMINVARGVENTPFLGVRVRFFAFLTFIVFGITCAGIVGGFLSPTVQNSRILYKTKKKEEKEKKEMQ